jgi:AraC family transcriptional regulator
MTIHIKNMVCDRCVKSVTALFEKAGITPVSVVLGVVETEKDINKTQESMLREALIKEGFEWLDDEKVKLVERVKQAIRQLVQEGELDELNVKLSVYLAKKLKKEYSYIAAIFSTVESMTIEQYFILQRIEKVKEWLVYGELSLKEIAFKLGYSSLAHLSIQFKNITGFTPSRFRQLKDHLRKPIDEV